MLPDVPIDKLANYPAYSFVVATLILIATATMIYRAVRDGAAPAKPQTPPADTGGVYVHAEGPLAESLKILRDIGTSVAVLRDLVPLLKQHHDELGERLREDRRGVYSRIEKERREIDAEAARRDERLNEMGERLARIEGQQGVRRR